MLLMRKLSDKPLQNFLKIHFDKMLISIPGMKRFWKGPVWGGCVDWVILCISMARRVTTWGIFCCAKTLHAQITGCKVWEFEQLSLLGMYHLLQVGGLIICDGRPSIFSAPPCTPEKMLAPSFATQKILPPFLDPQKGLSHSLRVPQKFLASHYK